MKRSFIIILVAFFTISCGKGEGETTLDIFVDQHPVGGTSVSSVDAIFDITRNFEDKSSILQAKGEPKDITIEVEWWWMSGDGASTEMVESETYTVSSDSDRIRYSYSAGSGYILLNYYYAKVRWTDDSGSYEIDTDEAYCTSSSNKVKKINNQELMMLSE
nr:hypothetical protein 8 [Balneolaceae bacterium]